MRESAEKSGKKKPGGSKKDEEYLIKKKVQTNSITDPETGYLNRPGKTKGFHYLNHQSQDSKYGIITDVHITPGNVNDFIPYIDRLKVQREKFGLKIDEVAADTGYDFPEVHYGLDQLKIKGYIAKKDTEEKDKGKVFPPSKFEYNEKSDVYICPNEKTLRFTGVNAGKYKKRSYTAKNHECQNCHLKEECCPTNKGARRIVVSFDRKSMNKNYKLIGTHRYKEAMALRKIYCEGNFGIMKENHNLRITRRRGIQNVLNQCLFSAMALNIKKLLKYGNQPGYECYVTLYSVCKLIYLTLKGVNYINGCNLLLLMLEFFTRPDNCVALVKTHQTIENSRIEGDFYNHLFICPFLNTTNKTIYS